MSKLKLTTLIVLSTLLVGCNQNTSENLPYTIAQKNYEDEHFAESLLHLKRSIQLYPEHIESRILISKVLLKMGEPKEAEQHIAVARSLGVSPDQLIVLQGLVLIKQGKYDEILEKLKLEGMPHGLSAQDHAMVYALIGQAQLAKGMINESLTSFNRAVMLDEECILAYIGLAVVNLNQDKEEKGLEYLNRAFSIDEKDIYAWSLKGDIERIQGDFKEAEKSYTKVIEHSYPSSLENEYARLYRALVQANRSDFEDAWRDIRKIKLNSVDDINLHYISGIIAFQEKDYNKAQAELETVLGASSEPMLAHYLLGAIHYMKDQPLQAREYLVYFINENPKNELAQKILALVEMRLGETQNAQLRLHEILEQHSKKPMLMKTLETEQGENSEVRAFSTQLEPSNSQLQYGFMQIKLDDYQLAESVFQDIIESNEESQVAQYHQLLKYIQSAQYQNAIDFSDRLLRENPNSTQIINFKGIAYLFLNQYKEARDQFNNVLAINKGDPNAHFNLAAIAMMDSDKLVAKLHLDAVVEYNPELIHGYLKQAQFSLNESNFKETESWLQKALQLQPNHIQASLILSKLYEQDERFPEALIVLEKLEGKAKNQSSVLLARAALYANSEQIDAAQQTLQLFERKYNHLMQSKEYVKLKTRLNTQERSIEKS